MKRILVAGFLMIAAAGMAAQKYGHLNFGNLIALMPETKAADEKLKSYQDSLVAKGQEMGKAFQEKYIAALKEVQAGTLSPMQQQKKQEELEKEQDALAQYEQEVGEKVQAKRAELLDPIVKKAELAIEEIAKANGYVMIFDTSVFNAILFVQEADDVLPLLKAKLKLSDPPADKK